MRKVGLLLSKQLLFLFLLQLLKLLQDQFVLLVELPQLLLYGSLLLQDSCDGVWTNGARALRRSQ